MKILLRNILFALCWLPLVATAGLFDLEEFYLDNGLRVVVVPNHKAPIVKMMLWYKVGSVDEPTGKGGLAHLLEHLMFRGTSNVPHSGFNDIVAKNGAESNAFTSHDFTVYHEFADISRLEAMMALEADRMANLDISEEAFISERNIVAQERRQRIKNNPSAIFAENMQRILWQGKEYGRPVSGTEEEITNLSLQDVKEFYNRFYSPNNAVLIISGDIDGVLAQKLVKKYFAKLKSSEIALAKPLDANKFKSSMRLESSASDIATTRIIQTCIVPSLQSDIKSFYAFNLFVNYLDSGDNSYLNQNLVLQQKAAAAGASYDGMTRKEGSFSIFAVPFPNNDIATTEHMLKQALIEAISKFDEEALAKEKEKIFADLVYVRDNPSEAAYLVGQVAALGLELDVIENYVDNIQNIKLEDVQNVTEILLGKSTCITGILQPDNIPTKEAK